MGVVTEQFATDKQFHSSGPPAKEPSHVPSQAFSSQRGARRGELYSFRGGKVGRRYSSGYGAGCRRECFFLEGEEREEDAGTGTTEAHKRFQRPYHGRENRHAESEEQEGEAHFC